MRLIEVVTEVFIAFFVLKKTYKTGGRQQKPKFSMKFCTRTHNLNENIQKDSRIKCYPLTI